jgi:hypothetical protein
MLKLILILVLVCFIIYPSYAEPIFTTYSDRVNNIIFDGKWTFPQEWKNTSLNQAGSLYVRTSHNYTNIYVLLDFISPTKFSKNSDYGVVCMTANLTKTQIPQKDDYCFLVTLGSNQPITLNGGSVLGSTGYFNKISNDKDLKAIGGISDSNDRYTDVPHMTYEFQIPVKIIGKYDKYKFYAAVYDTSENQMYSWPVNTTKTSPYPFTTSPSQWGDFSSPDKSLPEFPLPAITMVIGFFLLFYFTRKKLF